MALRQYFSIHKLGDLSPPLLGKMLHIEFLNILCQVVVEQSLATWGPIILDFVSKKVWYREGLHIKKQAQDLTKHLNRLRRLFKSKEDLDVTRFELYVVF